MYLKGYHKLNYMKVDEFITDYYSNLKCICKISPYISFGLICAGIEFLGKCLDEENEFQAYKIGLPERQFNLAVNELMTNYKEFNFYKNVRNGMLHALIPKPGIWLRER